jgi:hypothetical protein
MYGKDAPERAPQADETARASKVRPKVASHVSLLALVLGGALTLLWGGFLLWIISLVVALLWNSNM